MAVIGSKYVRIVNINAPERGSRRRVCRSERKWISSTCRPLELALSHAAKSVSYALYEILMFALTSYFLALLVSHTM